MSKIMNVLTFRSKNTTCLSVRCIDTKNNFQLTVHLRNALAKEKPTKSRIQKNITRQAIKGARVKVC